MKRFKWVFAVMGTVILIFTAACSGGNEESVVTEDNVSKNEMATKEESEQEISGEAGAGDAASTVEDKVQSERKVAYEGDLSLEVETLDDFLPLVEKKTAELGGYMVESAVYKESEEHRGAHLSVRVPSKHFQDFMVYVEENSKEVNNRNVRGQDVTEEYVDLESRLKAKKAVEERLLAFMEEAQKTEDLLKISNDLGRIQEEIEQLQGRMKYLDNRIEYASITMNVSESYSPKLQDREELNTWDKTKDTFITTLNGLSAFASWIFVALVGFSPVLILLAIIGAAVWMIMRRRKRKQGESGK
ncbi:DUF4349 domain-containing protein [Bacillus marinisedimentorum]|uniref:DUF4349 domain-containing protein n=1 Tax=Bacillus marinisedimentorum TaxID=1821260 RepID=UPI0007E00447|nr:DUF4349 domain-containing protein [Bacillus marinisedimentorum]